tara:strand:+ start:63 stop:1271 length:1209 start_codon:yes stop_codon:yes gene_type:complete
MKKVQNQYNKYPYPKPIFEMKEMISRGYREAACFDKEFWHNFFPEKQFNDELKIFIAGCGTNQAVYFSLKYPNSKIFAIDLSQTSISHNYDMIKKYNIKNLEIEKKSIFDIKIKEEFDFIISSGVIHHTEDPKKALKILVNSGLKDSAINIMVYASYLRVGVYFLQDIFRYLGLEQNENDIEFAKKFISDLPGNHFLKTYGELGPIDDSAFVDTFLHTQDKAYDCLEVQELIKGTGSFFQSWTDVKNYYPNNPKLNKFNKNLSKLSLFEIGDLTQKTIHTLGKHSFILRKNNKFENLWHNIESIKINNKVNKIPVFQVLEKPSIKSKTGGSLKDKRGNIYKLSLVEAIIYDNISIDPIKIKDLINSSKEFSEKISIKLEIDDNDFILVVHKFWKMGLVYFSY